MHFGVPTRHRDVVEKYVAVWMATGARDLGLQSESLPYVRASSYDENGRARRKIVSRDSDLVVLRIPCRIDNRDRRRGLVAGRIAQTTAT